MRKEKIVFMNKEIELFYPNKFEKFLLRFKSVSCFMGESKDGSEYLKIHTKRLFGRQYVWSKVLDKQVSHADINQKTINDPLQASFANCIRLVNNSSASNIIVDKDGRWFDSNKLIKTGFQRGSWSYFLTPKGTLIVFNSNPPYTTTLCTAPIYCIANEEEKAIFKSYLERKEYLNNLPAEKEV